MAKINSTYDVGAAFEAIEDELMASMIRNMQRHKVEEIGEAQQWSMWQVEMLHSLEKYRHDNQKKFGKQFQAINSKITGLIQAAKIEGGMAQETRILDAIRKGFPAKQAVRGGTAEFFKVNDRKLNALIEATQNDMQSAEAAVLRMANDQYRKIIFNAQMYANSGAGTYEKAVDMATKDFLSAGLNCIQYANGARHTIADYADMAIRTAGKRAYLQGEGQKRQEWGICTVIMNKRGSPCPKCLPFVGKVLVDDVWSGGPKSGKSPVTGIRYPLMSSAMAAGLYHPRCQDHHSTYFEGISEPPDNKYTREELDDLADQARQEAKQQYAARQEKRFGRLAEYSLDPENKKTYAARRELWKNSAQSLRNDLEYQDKISQRRAEWKKQHSVFDKEGTKSEINSLNSQIQDISARIRDSFEKEKILEKKVYIDGTGTDEDMRILRQSATERKKLQEQVEVLNNNMLDKQEAYKNEAEKRILKAGIVEEIKLSKKMTPDTVDALEDALTKLKDKYGIMPKGVVYNPSKVPDATVAYNWLDDKIYISNRFNDINKYADVVKKSEDSLIEYREKSGIVKIQKERLKNAEKILSDKNIKGYEREKAILNKATAEIELNTQRMAVRENLMDTLIHEYGHFIHRHANVDYVQKSGVFGAKDLGGKLINGDWKYDINSRYSANAKIEAAKISKYATESPYETFAEGFLAKEKGEKIPDRIAKIIDEAERKAGAKSVANTVSDDIIEISKDSTIYEGIPKNWKMLKSKEIALQSVNPKYATGDIAYKANCPNCVSAYEMRKRGYDVTAKPAGKNHYLNRNPETAWIDPDVRKATGSGKNDILKSFKEWPENSRAEIAVVWKGNNKGHVIVAEKIKGDVLFYDVQSGNALSENFWERIEEERTLYWRIDNIEPSDRGITACERGDIYEV